MREEEFWHAVGQLLRDQLAGMAAWRDLAVELDGVEITAAHGELASGTLKVQRRDGATDEGWSLQAILPAHATVGGPDQDWATHLPSDDWDGRVHVMADHQTIVVNLSPALERVAAEPIPHLPPGRHTITGVVDELGANVGWMLGEGHWLGIPICPWRTPEGAVVLTKVRVVRRDAEAALAEWERCFETGGIYRLKVEVAGSDVALTQKPEAVDDEELAAAAAQLAVPEEIDDPVIGTLTLDRRIDTFSGTISWCGTSTDLNLDAVDENDPEPALDTAKALLRDASTWHERVLARAVQHLLALKNESWLDPDEGDEPVDEAEFRSALVLESISASPEGRFTFWFEDGDLFWGHTIQVSGTLAEGPTNAQICG